MTWIFAYCPVTGCEHGDMFWGNSRVLAEQQLAEMHKEHSEAKV